MIESPDKNEDFIPAMSDDDYSDEEHDLEIV